MDGKFISIMALKPIIIRWIRTGYHPCKKICLAWYYIQFSTNIKCTIQKLKLVFLTLRCQRRNIENTLLGNTWNSLEKHKHNNAANSSQLDKLNVVWKNWLKQKVRANMQKLCSNCHWKKQSLTDQIFSVVKFAIWNWILTKNLKPMKHVTMFAKYQIKLKQEIHILKSLCTH